MLTSELGREETAELIDVGATRWFLPTQNLVEREHELLEQGVGAAELLVELDGAPTGFPDGRVGQVDVDRVQLTTELDRQVLARGVQEESPVGICREAVSRERSRRTVTGPLRCKISR